MCEYIHTCIYIDNRTKYSTRTDLIVIKNGFNLVIGNLTNVGNNMERLVQKYIVGIRNNVTFKLI